MPIVTVKLLRGRTKEQKRKVIRGITDAVCEHLAVRAEQVRVILEEMEPDDFGIAGEPVSQGVKSRSGQSEKN